MFGRLTLDAFKHDFVQGIGIAMMVIAGILAIGLLTYFKRWRWLWDEWLISLDPKRIGVMYLSMAVIMLFKGFSDAALMRIQQAFSVGDAHGIMSADHFQQIFTAHGTTMIFFVGMGAIFGLMNLVIPLQIGARDVAFPFLNAVSFWLFAAGAVLVNVSMVVGDFSICGWVAYPPLSGLKYSPGVGVDYWMWSVQIAGIGSLLAGINFWVTIVKMRCPGMTLMRMPLFVWSCLACLVLVIFAFPILTATIGMLTLDRLMGMHFFTSDLGGNAMMYVNLIWAWGHPEVYILVLPAFGVYSEVVATFSEKRLFGYVSMVWAIAAITFLSFIVWLHHFFTMGAGASVNAFFGIMTMIIAVPTGVKVFNWLFTMARGRIHFTTPMLWFLGFVVTFTTGGMTGVLMSIAPVDFQVHNSLFLIAHFHSMVIGGVLFGFFAGFAYWFPKVMGFKLNERLGKYAFWCWLIGFLVAFMPLYTLGLMGVTRRLDHYDAEMGWQSLFLLAAAGVAIIGLGIAIQVLQLIVSIKDRKKNQDKTGDPWNGRTLEWSTTSPPPLYNFARLPIVHDHDPFWDTKHDKGHGKGGEMEPYEPIHVPINTPVGMYIGLLAFLMGFGIIWEMTWLGILAFVGIVATLIIYLWGEDKEYTLSVPQVKKMERHK
jgi:cytochrome o ubiquinol oxidase subunit 1